jgi:copper(I)-binding protein
MKKGPNVKTLFPRTAIVVANLLIAAPAFAANVQISGAWFRALPAHLPAGGYFTLKNNGAAVQLKSAQSPACAMLMLHRSANVGGMESMTMVDRVDVPAGGTIAFAPGGYHLMCTMPTSAMTPGARVPVTLGFSDGSSVTVPFAVKNASGN